MTKEEFIQLVDEALKNHGVATTLTQMPDSVREKAREDCRLALRTMREVLMTDDVDFLK